MKKLLTLFLLIPFFATAQSDDVYGKQKNNKGVHKIAVPKNTSKIIVTTTQTAKENFKILMQLAISKDMFIDVRDTSLMYIKTQPKNLKNSMGLYFLNIVARDNEITITGMAKPSYTISLGGVSSTDDYEGIVNRGMKGSFFKVAFDAMDNFAEELHGLIHYK